MIYKKDHKNKMNAGVDTCVCGKKKLNLKIIHETVSIPKHNLIL